METLKIKVEIGDRKFEADGPPGIVQGQVNAFMKLTLGGSAETIAAEAAQAAAETARAAQERLAEEAARARAAQQLQEQVPAYDKILRISGTMVALTVRSRNASQAMLVLLLGQRELRNNTLVSGVDLLRGLRASGYRVRRSDNILNTLARWKYVTPEGRYRARRYQLTESGALSAQEIARQLLASLPTPEPPPDH